MMTRLRLALSLVILVSCGIGLAHAQAPAPRTDMVLTNWNFQPGLLPQTEPAPADWAPVTLPLLWVPYPSPALQQGAQGKSWAKLDLGNLDNAWLETRVAVPADWQGQRLYLKLVGLQCDAAVWVNGQKVGEVTGPDARIEITPAVTAGQDATIRLWITRWWQGVAAHDTDNVFRDTVIARTTGWAPVAADALRKATWAGIEDSVTLQARPATAEVDNVLVTPSFRTKQLRLDVDCSLHSPAPGTAFRVSVSELNGQTAGLPTATIPLDPATAAEVTHRQVLSVPWADPHLWEVGAPYLYLLHVDLVDADGRVLDSYPAVRFGFREVWTEGRNLRLNGHPLRLRLTAFTYDVPHLIFYEGMGFDTLEIQPNAGCWYGAQTFPSAAAQAGSKELLDAADERGWVVLMAVPNVSLVGDRLLEPAATAQFLRDMRSWLQRWDRQNRPSILMWCPAMNTASGYNPALIGRPPTFPQPAWQAAVNGLIKSVDPSRLVYYHEAAQPNSDVEMDNLYPNFEPLQEGEDHLSAWAQDGSKPWGCVEYQHPVYCDYFKFELTPHYTEYGAMYFGDSAYAMEKDKYIQVALKALQIRADRQGAPTHWTGQLDGEKFQAWEDFVAAGAGWGYPDSTCHAGDWTPYYDMIGLFVRNIQRSWRAYGMNGGTLSWDLPFNGLGDAPAGTFAKPDESLKQRPAWSNPLQDAYRDVSQPLLVYIGGPVARFTAKDHNFYAGEHVEKSLIAVWDGPGDRQLAVRWSLTVAGQAAQQGQERFLLAPGAIEKRPLPLTMPAVSQRASGMVKIEVLDATGAHLSDDSFAVTVFPVTPKLAAPALHWAIYDPVGQTAAELAKRGLQPAPLQLGQSLQGVDVLVIGREALTKDPELPYSATDVRRGLRVLVCEQKFEGLQALGFRCQDPRSRYVFPRTPQHPALAGVQPEDLINWRGEGTLLPETSVGMHRWPNQHAEHWGNYGTVASVVIETPHEGAFTPLLECEFDLAYSPLLEWREGAGTVVFCQLDLTGRLCQEPAADLLTRNLVHYLDTAKLSAQGRTVLCLDNPARDFVKKLGLEPAAPGASLDPKAQVAVIGPDQLGADSARLADLGAFAQAGGTIVVLPQSAANLQALALPWKFTVAAQTVYRVLPEPAPLLNGVGPELLHFRTFLDLQAFAATPAPAGAKRLLGGLLEEVPAGPGRWVFSQVDWRPLEDGSANLKRVRWNVAKFYRQLLTNCGARTAEPLAHQFMSPVHYAPLADVTQWQMAVNPTEVSGEHTVVNPGNPGERVMPTWALPGLGQQLEGDAWVNNPTASAWKTRSARAEGFMDFGVPGKLGKVGFAVTQIYSSVARQATFSLGGDFWFTLKVNGQTYVDESVAGRFYGYPTKDYLQVRVPLQAGWNQVEMKVASGTGGFGFWCQVSDPGDLTVVPAVAAPAAPPALAPGLKLLPDQIPDSEKLSLYAEPLTKDEDPYAYITW